jgi:hypothetical protein
VRLGRPFCILGIVTAVFAVAGCNQLLGLDLPIEGPAIDAPEKTGDDAAIADAVTGDDASGTVDGASPTDAAIDARVIDAPPASCGARGTPCSGGGYCNGAGACVACTTNTHCGPAVPMQCTMPVCSPSDSCTTGPAPRDTFCNNWADQCDGMGNCVDCTNSGGCGECCTCSLQQVCVPA